MSQTLLFQSSFNCDCNSVLFSHEFLIMLASLSPLLGRDALRRVQTSIFTNMEPALSLPLIEPKVNPKMWAEGKTLGQAQNVVAVIIKLNDPHLFSHQK